MVFKRGIFFGCLSIWQFLVFLYGAGSALLRGAYTDNFSLVQAVISLSLGTILVVCSIKYDRSERKRKLLIVAFTLSMLLTVVSIVVQFRFFLESGPVQIIVLLLSVAFTFVIEIFAISDLKCYVEYEQHV